MRHDKATGGSLPHTVRRIVVAIALMFGAASCQKPPAGPTPIPIADLTIACPVAQVVNDVVPPGKPVTFPLPQTTGGAAPVTTTCTPNTNAEFPLGTTAVACNATDSGGRFASCSFNVVLSPVPVTSATKFLAFGDSLTEGEVQTNVYDPDHSYPALLAILLRERYKAQTFTMTIKGMGGESADAGSNRLPGELDAHKPNALLLLQGVIDLALEKDDAVELVARRLRSNVREAKARGIHTFVSTLLPEKDALPGFVNRRFVPDDLLVETNDLIKAMAAEEGATLVDGYATIAKDPATLIGGDGLHLTVEGYQALAGAFFAAVQAKYELPPGSPLPALSSPLNLRTHVEVGTQRPRQPIRIRQR